MVASLIERFVGGEVDPYEWDDFMSVRHPSSELEKLRSELACIRDRFPPPAANQWCSLRGEVINLEQFADTVIASVQSTLAER